MLKKISVLCLSLLFFSCAELQEIASEMSKNGGGLSQTEIANGLKQALDKGIEKQVTQLAKEDGFYRNELTKILLPQELQNVESTLRKVGLGSLADEGIKALNRAAEDAVSRATPIFIDAVKGMTFTDAKDILMGSEDSATRYLENRTNERLYQEFHPEISNSFSRVGADQIWTNLITRYNSLPLTKNVNPDLTDYVTQEALNGVYKMIALEEKNIRENISARTTTLLRKVFSLQD